MNKLKSIIPFVVSALFCVDNEVDLKIQGIMSEAYQESKKIMSSADSIITLMKNNKIDTLKLYR